MILNGASFSVSYCILCLQNPKNPILVFNFRVEGAKLVFLLAILLKPKLSLLLCWK